MLTKSVRVVHSTLNKRCFSYSTLCSSFSGRAITTQYQPKLKVVYDSGALSCLNNFSSKNFYSSNKSTLFNVQDESDFDSRVLKEKTPVIVDFHAEWCGPCKLLGPRLEKEVESHQGAVILAKVDIDDLGDLAMEHKVTAVPTVMTFKNGKMIDQFQGNIDDDLLNSFVKKAASSS